MSDNDLSKSKIININDFIFRQYLEFYPNLKELSCEDNILTYKVNGNVIAEEILTFDLRLLPGHVWNYSAYEFMNVIRLNKKGSKLYEFIDFINKFANEPMFPDTNESEAK